MKSIDPYTLETIGNYPEDNDRDVIAKIERAERKFKLHRQSSFKERSDRMLALAHVLEHHREEAALLMTREMGKPIKEARAEIDKCVWVCRYYAENAEGQLAPDYVETDADQSFVSYEPLGVILAVMPWNFPFWQVFRSAVPTIMAGNTALLKHAANVQGCAGMMEKLFAEAGFDPGIFQNLRISSGRVEEVLRNPIIKAVSLTGSGRAGSAVAQVAGSEIKPSLLELGGSCGFIVLADADLELAARLGAKARMINTAQSCIAAKRFIVVEEVYEQFLDLFISEMKKFSVGDPKEENTQIGPLARVDLAEQLEQQMEDSVRSGANLVMGGERRDASFEPAVLSKVKPGMPAFDEELFGPVAAVVRAQNAEEAVRLNNLSQFGLGASIITSDVEYALKLAGDIEDGAVFINELVKSDPRIPFGGTKKSGYGRELGALGIREFVNAKTVHVKERIRL
jgi:succinate-semialdehyde dehydrogenase/glutarate-semialdehyde dehydrogenase